MAIITNAGGPGILATDACIGLGLRVPPLSKELQKRIAPHVAKEASLRNPVDLLASAEPKDFAKVLDLVLASEEVDMAMVISVPWELGSPMEMVELVSSVAKKYPKIPVLLVIMAEEKFYQKVRGREDLLPIFTFPETAAKAASKLFQYSQWKARPVEPVAVFDTPDEQVERLLNATPSGEYLPQKDAFQILRLYGIQTAEFLQVEPTWESVQEGARRIGFPLVLKVVSKALIHKSDQGGVAVNLEKEEELRKAFEEMKKKFPSLEGFLLQEFVPTGYELIFGASKEPRFGPILMFGLGGKFVEVLEDVNFAIPPLSPQSARETIEGIRSYPILRGIRGEEGVHLETVQEVLLRLSQLVERHPRISELDINPFLANSKRENCKAVDVRIRVE